MSELYIRQCECVCLVSWQRVSMKLIRLLYVRGIMLNWSTLLLVGKEGVLEEH